MKNIWKKYLVATLAEIVFAFFIWCFATLLYLPSNATKEEAMIIGLVNVCLYYFFSGIVRSIQSNIKE